MVRIIITAVKNWRFTNIILAVNGVLLKDNTHEKEVYISDCIPLFHQVREVIHTLKSNICSVTVPRYMIYRISMSKWK